MTLDLDLSFDPELERHLRTIAGHEPEMPARIARYAANVAAGRTKRVGDVDLVMERLTRPALVPRPGRAALALVAVALVVAVGAAGLVALQPNGTTSSASPELPALWGGLEWHDVTATAFPATTPLPGLWTSGGIPTSVLYWHGAYYANPGTILWSSTDGADWHQVQGAPQVYAMAATADMLVLQDMGCSTVISYTTDGKTWRESKLPLDGYTCSMYGHHLAATQSAVVAVVFEDSATSPVSVWVPYRSTDGATWTMPEMPADMAAAFDVVAGGRAGFLAAGRVLGSVQETASGYPYEIRFWYSRDGSSWQKTVLPDDFAAPATLWFGSGGIEIQRGSLGDWMDARGHGYHSLDDSTWIPDSEPVSFSGESHKVSSDGSRILAQTTGPTFYVSLGDESWRQLANGGDADGMPDGGQSFVLPAGVLYIADGHVFFGTPIQG